MSAKTQIFYYNKLFEQSSAVVFEQEEVGMLCGYKYFSCALTIEILLESISNM